MRVEIENGIVVCGTDSDWKALPENEHDFLSKCYPWWQGFTESGKLMWFKFNPNATAQTKAYAMNMMIIYAKERSIEVTDEVKGLYSELKEAAEEELILQERLAFLECKRRTWEYRQRTGCEDCNSCERIGDGWFRCKYSGDELEARFSEVWDPVTQCMLMFHEVGIPNTHCKDYYQERKEWR